MCEEEELVLEVLRGGRMKEEMSSTSVYTNNICLDAIYGFALVHETIRSTP